MADTAGQGRCNAAERRSAVGAPAEEDAAPGEVANGLARAYPPNFNIVENVNARARTFHGESCYQPRWRPELSMVSTQHILGLIEAGRVVRRRPLVGTKFLKDRRAADRAARSSHKLMIFFVSQLAGSRRNVPRCTVALRVFTPHGLPRSEAILP